MGVHRPPVALVREDPKTGTVLLDVVVVPSAARTEIRGTDPWRHGLVVRVAAKATEGAANAELVRFLAARLGVAPSGVRIVAGHRSRRKTLAVMGIPRDAVMQRVGEGDR